MSKVKVAAHSISIDAMGLDCGRTRKIPELELRPENL